MAIAELDILYRGPLASCNYDCGYCPFAKRRDSREALHRDATALGRFIGWVEAQRHRSIAVLFTPWGEALIRAVYRTAMIRLSHMSHVRTVAIQTNLSCRTGWMADCAAGRAAFWCTYHPGEVSLSAFLRKCREMDMLGVRYSVGMVGKKEHWAALSRLRKALCPDVYLWVNAFKDEGPGYYSAADVALLASIDPLFEINLAGVRSLGRACHAGEIAISVDG
jgi:hypothetical protein